MFVKKLASLSLALALVYSISLPARAELLKNFKADGSIELRTINADNLSDGNGLNTDNRSDMRTRVLVGGSFDLLDDVHSRVLLSKNNRLYGNNVETVQDVQSALEVQNAYVKIDKVFGHVDLTLGRQFYGRSDGMVIYFGPNDDDILSVNALDIVRMDADITSWVKATGIVGKTFEATGAGLGAAQVHGAPAADYSNTDNDIWGIELNSDKVIPQGNLGVYYYTSQNMKGDNNGVGNPATKIGNDTLNIAGVRAVGDVTIVPGLGYEAEYANDFGRNNNVVVGQAQVPYRGKAFDLIAKYAKDLLGKPVRAKVEYAKGTGDWVDISASKRYGKIFGEHDSAGPSFGASSLSNLIVYTAGAGVNPLTKLGVDLNWYRFRFSDGNGTPGTVANQTSIGSELDLVLSWKHSENVSFDAYAARFWIGSAMTTGPGTSPVTQLGTDVKIKF